MSLDIIQIICTEKILNIIFFVILYRYVAFQFCIGMACKSILK